MNRYLFILTENSRLGGVRFSHPLSIYTYF